MCTILHNDFYAAAANVISHCKPSHRCCMLQRAELSAKVGGIRNNFTHFASPCTDEDPLPRPLVSRPLNCPVWE